MLKTKEEIENWLNEYEIANFIINDDLSVDINGDVKLEYKEIEEFPFQFGVIKGNFDCSYNCLISLKNTPKEINGYFDCSNNNLNNLKYCPKEIGGFFDCSHNDITNLNYCPKEIGAFFNCSCNKLTNLKNSPKIIQGDFYCFYNKLTDLKHCPKEINGDFYCTNNKLRKELLYFFNSNIKDDVKSDFGDKEEFLKLVELSKNIKKEKKELNKIIIPEINSSLIKKRL